MDAIARAVEAARAMQELARIAAEQDQRPDLIRAARAAGISWPDIAEAAKVSRATAINLSKIGAADT